MVHYGRLAIILFAKNSKFLAHHMHIVFCGLSMHVAFVDQIVHAFLPDKHGNWELHNLVKLYQLHRH